MTMEFEMASPGRPTLKLGGSPQDHCSHSCHPYTKTSLGSWRVVTSLVDLFLAFTPWTLYWMVDCGIHFQDPQDYPDELPATEPTLVEEIGRAHV